jgi:DNA-directed RNA polymerase subunit B'
MERDSFIGHGASMALKDRLLDESDQEMVNVCAQCGMTAVEDVNRDRIYCENCDEEADIHEIETSYAFSILLDEMKALGIAPKIHLEDSV